MQDDPFPAAERILCDIETVFRKDKELREFDVIPVTVNENKSPVHHVEHCLGLESWCIRHVYCYAYHRLMDARQQKHRRTEPSTLSRLLLGALLLNPDVQTFWNMRRELTQAGRLDISSELHFSAVVLSRKPKSSEAFAYRKWLLLRLLTGDADVGTLLEDELKVAQCAGDHYANNYHAWHHRMWCVMQMASVAAQPFQPYLSEWSTSESWISMHVSDHSGLQYRQFLLKQLCKLNLKEDCKSPAIASAIESTRKSLHQYLHPLYASTKQDASSCDGVLCSVYNHNSCKLGSDSYLHVDHCTNSNLVISLGFVISELLCNAELILRYTGHEALWYHRRFSLSLLKTMVSDLGDGFFNFQNGKNMAISNEINCFNEKAVNEYKLPSQCSKLTRTIEIHVSKSQMNSHPDIIEFKRDQVKKSGNVHQSGGDKHTTKGKMLAYSEVYSEEENEICHLISKAVILHENQLLNECRKCDSNQYRLAVHHHRWLADFMGLQAHSPDQQ